MHELQSDKKAGKLKSFLNHIPYFKTFLLQEDTIAYNSQQLQPALMIPLINCVTYLLCQFLLI